MEKLSAQIVVEVDQSSLKQSEQEIERLKSPTALKMAIDLGSLRQQLTVLKTALKEALDHKTGNKTIATQLGGDIEILKKQITQAGRELTNFVRTGDKELSVLGKMFQQVGVDMNSGFGKVLASISGSFAQTASSALQKVGLGATNIGQSMQAMGAEAEKGGFTLAKLAGPAIISGVVALGTAVFKLGSEALSLADKYEQAELSFKVMLGSGEKAKTLLADLSQFASKTPFEIQGIRQSAKQLLAFGISGNSIIGTLKILGDVASATGTPLEQISYAYGQVRTANQLYGTELRQFMNAGVPILAELAKMYGVTEKAAKKMVEDGKISFNDVQQAFVNMTSAGGLMANMMGVQAETLTGKWSNMKDSFSIFLEQMGAYLIPTAKMIVDGMQWLFDGIKLGLSNIEISMMVATNFIIDSWYSVTDVFNAVSIFIQKFSVLWTATFSQYGDNVAVFIQNVGIAFDNMPAYIQSGLNKGLEAINGFVNKAGEMLNGVSEFFGSNKLVGKVDFKLDFAGPKKDFQEMNSSIIDAGVQQALALDVIRTEHKQHTVDMKKINDDTLKGYIYDKNSQLNVGKELNYGLEKVAGDAEEDKKKSNKKGKDLAKEAQKEREKIYKDAVAYEKKVFADMAKNRQDDLTKTKEYITKLKDAIKEINDIEKDMVKENKDSQADIEKETASHYRDLLEQKKGLVEDLRKATEEMSGTASLPDPALQKGIDEAQKQIDELQKSGLLTQSAKAKEDQRASLDTAGQSRFDFQDKVGTTAIDNANKQAELQQKKTDIETRLGLKKSEAEQELIIQETRKAKNERALKQYASIIDFIEKGVTDNTQKEIDKRMSAYNIEEQRLLRLIELRTQAGYAVGVVAPQAITNTVNNTPNVTVNANVASSVDINALANTLARKITLSNKGIS